MSENKTTPTSQSVDAFIARVAHPQRRADAFDLRAMMERLSGEPAVMWGASIVGFGTYHYRYDSGHSGSWARIGFSPRAREMVIYLMDGYTQRGEQLARLGKHRIGKSCLYINRLSDVDQSVLEAMIVDSLGWMAKKYP